VNGLWIGEIKLYNFFLELKFKGVTWSFFDRNLNTHVSILPHFEAKIVIKHVTQIIQSDNTFEV